MSDSGPISMGLVNHWIFSDEYVKIDLSKIHLEPTISTTIDILREDQAVRIFVVTSSWEFVGNCAKLTLTYDAEANSETFPGTEFQDYWGTAKIEIDLNSWTAKAEWIGQHTKKWNGTADAKIIRSGLIEEKKRVTVTKLERRQQRLRKALLLLDKRCAICGEESPEVLDAAHIISAADGGREVVENAILLRADLHRLLDFGLLEVDSSGRIFGDSKLPRQYLEVLHEKQLPADVFARVQKALAIASTAR